MDPTSLNQNENQTLQPQMPQSVVPQESQPVMPQMSQEAFQLQMPQMAQPQAPQELQLQMPQASQESSQPVMPQMPQEAFQSQTPQMSQEASQPQMSQMPQPVNPVVNPGASVGLNPNVAMPALDPSLVIPDNPSGVAGANAADVMVGATDPITMPNLPKAPDPVEEELKAPMTAAAPVPGSIGSAISMPAEQPQTPNVAFNDPATVEQQFNTVANPAKKKMDKKTLIMLCAVAGIAVVALVIVLIMMLNGGLV